MTEPVSTIDRRDFIRLGALAGTGLLLGVRIPERGEFDAALAAPFQPNVFVHVDPSGEVTITLARSEMGQGVRTALPMIVADELDADWSRVRVVQASAHPNNYGSMMTVGSTSVRGGAWMRLRRAGAAARAMLVAAAAARWNVPATRLRTENGRVIDPSTRRAATYGELADAAAAMTVPDTPPLKTPEQFRLIGTRVPLVDARDKVSGRAIYGIDVRTPGMLFATVVHPPVFGGKLKSIDDTAAKVVRGVRHVIPVTQGVAVVADSTWAAIKGARALRIDWDNGAFAMSSAEIFAEFARLAEHEGAEARSTGEVSAALANAAHRVSATYEAPYLAHATMEPMNCTAHVQRDRCEIWAPTQNPQGTQRAAAGLTNLPVENVIVHTTNLGCGWGRRSATDFVQDAVETSMKVGAPVQVLWTREEDMQHDLYRPAAHVRFEGAADASGKLTALRARVVAQGIAGRGAVDGPAVSGISDTPYAVPNFRVEYVRAENPVPVGYWRSVGPSQNAFFLESFLDELAHAANRDPVEFRLEMLGGNPRLKRVLEVAAERAGWAKPAPKERARGVALLDDRGGRVAEIAEVSLDEGRVRVHRVTCVVDCGQVIHPGIVEAQMSGSVIAGLAAALYGEITIDRGRVAQGNFDTYQMLRIPEAPAVDVHIIPSHEEPGGVGEPGLPPIAPAVANALFRLTGKRVRRLPIRAESLTAARG
jgi:isoquinoline 1-oxidoreductase beta subunit